jgi:hypothetical protein
MSVRPYTSFAQDQGLAALPEQAKVGSISQATTAGLWRIVHADLHDAMNSRYKFSQFNISEVLTDWWVEAQHQMAHEIPVSYAKWISVLTPQFTGFPQAYNAAQYFLEHPKCPEAWRTNIPQVLEATRAAYRVVENKIVPFGSEQEMAQLKSAIMAAEMAAAPGSKAHLITAATEMTSGNWAGSVHEAISAVEAAARVRTGEHGKGLSELLTDMRKSGQIQHPALAGALVKLYAYSSDEKGIRHSLVLDGQAAVTEREAFLMLGLCASMTTYLLGA